MGEVIPVVKLTETISIQKQKKKEKRKALEIFKTLQESKVKRELKNLLLFLGLFAGATSLRVLLQGVPSVEPIIPLAILAGLIFGPKEGFMLGTFAYIVSNFFIWGLQGPWTIFQALGGAIPGMLAGFFTRLKKPNTKHLVGISVIGTIIFEFLVNIGGFITSPFILTAGLLSFPIAFLTYSIVSLPFSLVHITTNAGFSFLFKGLLKFRRDKNESFKIVSVTGVHNGKPLTVRMYKSNTNE